MKPRLLEHLNQELLLAKEEGRLRQLLQLPKAIDLCSNDYLGLSRSANLKRKLIEHLSSDSNLEIGATGSRLVSGHNQLQEKLEEVISKFHNVESALLFPSAYQANIALLSTISKRNDTILYDQKIHASLRDGIRLANCKAWSFQHNNLTDLSDKIRRTSGQVFVVVEGLYSMDGDIPDFNKLTKIVKEVQGYLIVDEAHSVGIYGKHGEGITSSKSFEEVILARTIGYGKAFGVSGGAIIGSKTLIDYLINFSRPFIFTTGINTPTAISLLLAYQIIAEMSEERGYLFNLCNSTKNLLSKYNQYRIPTDTPIQTLLIPGNEQVLLAEKILLENNFNVRAIRHPTVEAGQERLRITLHSFNTVREILSMLDILENKGIIDVKK